MSQTRILCEKCGYPQCYCTCHEIIGDAWNKWIATKRGKAMVDHANDHLTGKPFLNVLLLTFRAGYEARLSD